MNHLGKNTWVIAEGYIPKYSTGSDPDFTSHETACILNTGKQAAHLKIYIFFSDKEPIGPYLLEVPGRRTLHLRFNELENPEPIPKGIDYSAVMESNVPIVVQHTRLDSRQAENGLLSTIAYYE